METDTISEQTDLDDRAEDAPVDRRGLLGRLVAGAAGAAAAAVVLDAGDAQAAPSFELNVNNTSTINTNLSGPGGTLPWAGPAIGLPVVLSVQSTIASNNAFAARGGDVDDSYGVYGAASFGVVGIGSAPAAQTDPTNPSRGVWGLGNAAGSTGVVAQQTGTGDGGGAPLRIADHAASAVPPGAGSHLVGELAVRAGNLWMCVVAGTPGTWVRIVGPATRGSDVRLLDAAPTADGTAPSAGTFTAGEMFESSGRIWLCTAGGTPGTWRNLNPAPPAGNVVAIVPGRVLDTRSGAPLAAGEERTVNVATSLENVALVPANATGVLYNLTVTDTAGLGFLAIYPAGATYPGTSSINWTTTGAVIANSGVSSLGPSTSVILRGGAGTAHAIIDVTGYIV